MTEHNNNSYSYSQISSALGLNTLKLCNKAESTIMVQIKLENKPIWFGIIKDWVAKCVIRAPSLHLDSSVRG